MDWYKFDQVVINNSFHVYNPGQADPIVGSEVASSSSKFCPYEMETIKAKIMAHPHYSTLLQAYLDCRQVGAPPDVVDGLVAARRDFEAISNPTSGSSTDISDRELDNFMEVYYEMLVRYREELSRPIQEATEFMRRIESQLTVVVNGSATGDGGQIFHHSDDKYEDHDGSSEDDEDTTGKIYQFSPHAEDDDLRNQLLRKYSGRLSSLKQELSKKKKKKGKLPKEAREKLFSWWESHQRWPYPSESEKLALTESTGLDPKQINNWFINQRKRHWKPYEDMDLMMMNGILQEPQTQSSVLCMDGHHMNDYNYGSNYNLGP